MNVFFVNSEPMNGQTGNRIAGTLHMIFYIV